MCLIVIFSCSACTEIHICKHFQDNSNISLISAFIREIHRIYFFRKISATLLNKNWTTKIYKEWKSSSAPESYLKNSIEQKLISRQILKKSWESPSKITIKINCWRNCVDTSVWEKSIKSFYKHSEPILMLYLYWQHYLSTNV